MLESTVKPLKEAGWRPVAAFDAVTVFNIVFALLLATLLFSGFEIPTS